MAKDDKVLPPPADTAAPPASPARFEPSVGGLPGLQEIAAQGESDQAKMAGLLAHRVNTGMAGEGARLAFDPDLAASPLDPVSVADLVDAAIKAKVGPGGASRWLRERFPEVSARARAAADYS
jgi:hypothetical protein